MIECCELVNIRRATSFSLLDECLSRGQWSPAVVDFPGYCHEFPCRHRCPQTGARALSVWRSDRSAACATLLPTQHNSTYGHALNQATELFLVGDSVTWQIATTLRWAATHNPHLARLRVVSCFMSVIPRLSRAIDDALQDCLAQGSGGGRVATPPGRRIIVVNVGLWYQPTPWCAPVHMQESPGCLCCKHAALNETHPDSTHRPAAYTWNEGSVYNAMRRFTGTSIGGDYGRDVRNLASALERVRAVGVKALWLSSTPQHFPPFGPYDVAELRIPTYDEQPQNHREGRPSFNGTCLNEVPPKPEIRNDLALPIVREFGIPTLNLWEALRRRGDMHKGHDCTHWCEPGDAVWLMANAVLGGASLVTARPALS